MLLALGICCAAMGLLVFSNCFTMDEAERSVEEKERQLKEKELKYKIKIDQLEQDVVIRDDIIRAYRDGGFRSEKD